MASEVKDKVVYAGHNAAVAVRKVGHKIVDVTGKAVEFVEGEPCTICGKRTNVGVSIKERMQVIAQCGKKVGVLDHFEGRAIKMTKNYSPGGQHHFIPVGKIEHVDSHVHLRKK